MEILSACTRLQLADFSPYAYLIPKSVCRWILSTDAFQCLMTFSYLVPVVQISGINLKTYLAVTSSLKLESLYVVYTQYTLCSVNTIVEINCKAAQMCLVPVEVKHWRFSIAACQKEKYIKDIKNLLLCCVVRTFSIFPLRRLLDGRVTFDIDRECQHKTDSQWNL